MTKAEDMLTDHINRMGLNQARLTDSATQATVNIARQCLRTVELAMEDEGIDPAVITRVLRLAIYGAMPNRVDLDEKAEIRGRLSDHLNRGNFPMVAPPNTPGMFP